MNEQMLKEKIRERYGAAAQAAAGSGGDCCGTGKSVVTGELYQHEQVGSLPDGALAASLGCGNPTALTDLLPGEIVLDLGSGGGIDVLLSARRVGPSGRAYGLDMTDEMLALARENQRQAGVTNVEFLKGDIEAIPLPDNSVDVIISNCVINLAADKQKVFSESFRVLKPGGRFAVSDMVFQGNADLIPAGLRRQIDAWAGCIAGALEEQTYLDGLRAAGFTAPTMQVTRVYGPDLLAEKGRCGAAEVPAGIRLVSGFVRARKPGAGEVTVRPATAPDLPAVRRLLKEAGLPPDGLETQFGEGYAVAEAGGHTVGAVGVERYGDAGLLRSAVVDAPWRGLGIGASLVRDRLAWALRNGLTSLWLLTTTAADYFPRFGFEPADRHAAPARMRASAEFASACPVDAMAFKLDLK